MGESQDYEYAQMMMYAAGQWDAADDAKLRSEMVPDRCSAAMYSFLTRFHLDYAHDEGFAQTYELRRQLEDAVAGAEETFSHVEIDEAVCLYEDEIYPMMIWAQSQSIHAADARDAEEHAVARRKEARKREWLASRPKGTVVFARRVIMPGEDFHPYKTDDGICVIRNDDAISPWFAERGCLMLPTPHRHDYMILFEATRIDECGDLPTEFKLRWM